MKTEVRENPKRVLRQKDIPTGVFFRYLGGTEVYLQGKTRYAADRSKQTMTRISDGKVWILGPTPAKVEVLVPLVFEDNTLVFVPENTY